MTIASEIARIQGNIADAYNACAAKGATMPVTNNSASLANTINTISGGGGGSGGVVGNYMVVNGVAMPQDNNLVGRFDGIVGVETNALNAAFSGKNNFNTVVNFSDLEYVNANGMSWCFNRCMNITGLHFPKLHTVNDFGMYYLANYAVNVSSISFPSLQNIGTYGLAFAFVGTNIIEANFSQITDISSNSYNAFQGAFWGTSVQYVNFSRLFNVGSGTFRNACKNCTNLTSANFSNVVICDHNSFLSCFSGAQGNFTVDFSNVTYITGDSAFANTFENSGVSSNNVFPNLIKSNYASGMNYCFYNCPNITEFTFPSLTNGIGMRGCFSHCSNLTDLSFPNLINIYSAGMSSLAQSCTNLTNVYWPNLAIVTSASLSAAFYNCVNLKTLSFPNLSYADSGQYTPFNDMLYGCTDVTVHFPAAMQSVIGSWSVVLGGFSGTNTTVLFDL